VGNAYLESHIDKELYMLLPKDLWVDGNPAVVRLHKAIYGLKQARELWFRLLAEYLGSMGFEKSTSDTCLFIRLESDGSRTFIMAYVDDLILVAPNRRRISELKASLEKRFTMKHQGDLSQFLGMTFKRDRENRTLTIDQSVYARAVVAEMLDSAAKTSDIPGTPSVKLRLLPDGEKEPIQDVVGKLRYLADRMRPVLLAAVNELGSGAAKPGVEHLRAAKRVLRYLKGTVESCLLLGGVDSMIPLAYCDASYTAEGDSKSQFGYCIHLHSSGASIVKSKTATTIPHSPCEAEVKAMDEATREIVWLRELLEEIGMKQRGWFHCSSSWPAFSS
jgi:hypothetical protein